MGPRVWGFLWLLEKSKQLFPVHLLHATNDFNTPLYHFFVSHGLFSQLNEAQTLAVPLTETTL